MSASPKKRDEQPAPPDPSTVLLLVRTMGDTTWRMFVPTVGCTIGGLLLDKHFATTPWYLIIGIVLGTALSTLLIYRQLKKVKE